MTDPDLQATPTTSSAFSLIRRIVLWTLLLIVFTLLSLSAWYYLYISTPGPQAATETVVVSIPRGTSVRTIGEILSEAGVIKPDIRFLILAKLSGYGKRLQAGEFRLQTGRKPGDVLKDLASARSIQYSVTIPEGLRASEIAEIFGEGGWCDPSIFNALVYDKQFLQKLGFPGLDSLEGYLFPDTYLLTKESRSADKLIAIMVNRFEKVWADLTANIEELPDRTKTVILASIVEKETGAAVERPLIAGVFHNRLRIGMRLQSDPTVIYGIENFTGPITRKNLREPTPYNTYTIPGLPIGPISNPGKDAIEAVLHPAETKSLYFVSKNDGTHQFSATLKEHNRAVQKYQRKKSAKKGK